MWLTSSYYASVQIKQRKTSHQENCAEVQKHPPATWHDAAVGVRVAHAEVEHVVSRQSDKKQSRRQYISRDAAASEDLAESLGAMCGKITSDR